MLRGDRYEVDGLGFNSLAGAIGRARRGRRRAATLSDHRDPFVIINDYTRERCCEMTRTALSLRLDHGWITGAK
jgi:hypothetical protein